MKKIYILILALVSINFATSQVTGKVSGADGTPITGVNVVEKGTSNGAISDFDGNYEISAASNATLVFSYVGYETLEVAVANQSVVNVTLQDGSSLDEVIDVHHYKAIGTMKKSLSNHADEAYDELNEHEKQVCEKMFKALVNFESVNITRNPVEFGSLVKIIETDPSVLIKVINTFNSSKRSFLRPKAGENIKDSSVIDISHESLLRLWTRLQSWTKEEMESSETYKNLCETAKDYQEGKGSLLINPELAIVLKWKEKQLPSKGWGLRYDKTFPRAINFLENSKTKFNQEVLNKSLFGSQDP